MPRGNRGPARMRMAVIALLVLGTWWNLGLMAQFGGGLMDRQRLTLADNAYDTFVTVPRRLPEARLPLRLRAALLLRAAARGLHAPPMAPAPASPAPTTPQ